MSLDIEALKTKNSQELPRMDKPYQLAVYAIPEEQWAAFTKLMQRNLPLLPEVLEYAEQSATESNLNQQVRSLQSSITELSRQAGKDHDSSLKRLRDLEISLSKQLGDLWWKIRIWLSVGFGSLLVFSVLLAVLAG